MPSHRLTALAASAAVLTLAFAACSPLDPRGEGERTAPSATPSAEATDEAAEAVEDRGRDVAEALAERDRFIADQQQPLDGSPLVAKTPEQVELVAAQRAYIESEGGRWSPEAESLTLALALDACETSILNGHAVDVDVFRGHVATSPLISAVSGGDPLAVEGAISIMVFGTGYLCPDDADQWVTAWRDAGGEY